MNSSSDNSCSLSTTNKSVATNSSDTKIPPQLLATATAATCSSSSMISSINSTTCTPQNCNDKKKKKKKKSVHFNKELQINYPPNNLSHNSEDLSSNNALLWYTPQDYNKFKFQAAKSAGVNLNIMVPSKDNDISNSKQRDDEFKERRRQLQSIFVMVGNFDTKLKKENEDTNIIITAAANISSESSSRSTDTIIPTIIDNNAKKRDNTKKRKTMSYHNENEYNDQHAAIIVDVDSNIEKEKEEEVTVCKRGLGYHFSTSRKRTRHTSRLAVLAWQKALQQSDKNDDSSKKVAVSSVAVSAAAANTVAGGGVTNNKVSSRALLNVAEATAAVLAANAKSNTNSSANDDNNSNSKSSTELQNDKQILTLSIISSKCSRTSRHEAIWRGDVDYRIAYPERFADADGQSSVHNGNQQQQSAAAKIHGHGTRNVVHGEVSNNMGSNDKKRAVGNDGTRRIKRRKVTTDDSNNIVPLSCPNESIDEALSPETIGYLVKGILHADV